MSKTRLRELHTRFSVLLGYIVPFWMFNQSSTYIEDIDRTVKHISESINMLDNAETRMKLHAAFAVWFDKTHELMELVAEATKED